MTSRDSLASDLLRTERDALMPLLGRTEPAAFDRPTVCTGWSVRDVLAHCGSVLGRAAEGRLGTFTAEENEQDVDLRRGWPLAEVLAELERGFGPAAEALAAADGRLDGVALGVWVHGGDVRDALGEPWAYGSAGADNALALLVQRSAARSAPLVHARVDGREVTLGSPVEGRPAATLATDLPTLVRLYAGRRPDPARYRMHGASPQDLVLFT